MLKTIKITLCLLPISLSVMASEHATTVPATLANSPKDLRFRRDSLELAHARGVKPMVAVDARDVEQKAVAATKDELADGACPCVGPLDLDEFIKLPYPVSKALAQGVAAPK